ncbi:MAG: ribosome maturation factor RimP [Firmicutes bacterium]|nr:ribosome maturation factor RimP [Bacillota bacterium]
MKRDPRIEKIEQLIGPYLEKAGLELVDIELKREAVGLVLRIYIDTKNGGIDLDTLAKASQKIGSILDETDIITQKYILEVSSPGIERPLTKPEHFKRFVGSKISVRTLTPIGKRKQFKGRLVEAGGKTFTVEIDGEHFEIAYDNVSKARLQVDIEF